MKVIGFNGSARKDGNTAILIRYVFEGLEKEGIETELYHPNGAKNYAAFLNSRIFKESAIRSKSCFVALL